MFDYARIWLPSSACVHFVHNDEIEEHDLLRDAAARVRANKIVCAYIDYEDAQRRSEHLREYIARTLKLEHAPYWPSSKGPVNPWVPFWDDLISLSDRVDGMVLIIDSAETLLQEDQRCMLDLIEVFLGQFHHWYDKPKPCHLCFQLEKNEGVRQVFGEFSLAT